MQEFVLRCNINKLGCMFGWKRGNTISSLLGILIKTYKDGGLERMINLKKLLEVLHP